MSLDPVLDWTLRLALGWLFAAAAHHKLRDLAGFGRTLEAYRIGPARLVRAMAPAVPLAESAVAGLLLVRPWAGAAGALLLLATYGFAIGVNLARGRRDIDCGCLGPARGQPLAPWLLFRNALLAAGAAALLLPTLPRTLLWLDVVTVAGAALLLALLWSTTHRLAALAPAARLLGRST